MKFQKLIQAFALLILSVGCSGGSSSSQSNVYSIVPGITNLDSSAQSINTASFYEVITSSSTTNKVTVGSNNLGSYINPAGQSFAIESKKRIEINGTDGEIVLKGVYNLQENMTINLEMVWDSTNRMQIRLTREATDYVLRYTLTRNGVDIRGTDILANTIDSANNLNGEEVELKFKRETIATVPYLNLYFTTASVTDSLGMDLLDGGSAPQLQLLQQNPYLKISVSNTSSTDNSFVINSVTSTFTNIAK